MMTALDSEETPPPHAVELASVGIGASQSGDEHPAEGVAIFRQNLRVEEHALARATAVEDGGNEVLAHAVLAIGASAFM